MGMTFQRSVVLYILIMHSTDGLIGTANLSQTSNMIFSTNPLSLAFALVAGLLTALPVNAAGNVYFYDCYNCGCDAYQEHTGWSGTTPCIAAGGEWGVALSIGLTRDSHQTTCSFYSDNNCQNQFQSAGVNYWQTWGCTNGNQYIGSVRCYYNT
jgi:hypothetical protein